MPPTKVHITETARDAMQGITTFIPTNDKVNYINALLKVGFDVVDCGSYVSPKVIPQMADSDSVIRQLQLPEKKPEIMALVVNETGVRKASENDRINCLSYPFSVSPTFLKRNLNISTIDSLALIDRMQHQTALKSINWVIYLSMGFGNPYGDDWSSGLVIDLAARLYEKGFTRLPLSDILGEANPDTIYATYQSLCKALPQVDFGLHLHTKPSESFRKLEAAWEAGVRSFETVVNGLGGCPTAADEMVGNLSTQNLLHFLSEKNALPQLNFNAINEAGAIAGNFSQS